MRIRCVRIQSARPNASEASTRQGHPLPGDREVHAAGTAANGLRKDLRGDGYPPEGLRQDPLHRTEDRATLRRLKMKCEICHKAEAETAVTTTQDGVEKELYVCSACAASLRGAPSRNTRNSSPKVSVIKGSSTTPPPFVEELVKATLGFMKGVAEAEENEKRVCPHCKATWEQIKESGHVGCPSCWKTFACQIRDEFLSVEFGKAHVGSAPAIDRLPDLKSIKTVLERDLKLAIQREDYHLAALLKNKLDALGEAEGNPS